MSVGADSYALTLWAFLHSKDAQRIEDLTSEIERIDLADMVTRGWLGGTKEIETYRTAWRDKLGGERGIDELRAAAEELSARHERLLALKLSGPVS